MAKLTAKQIKLIEDICGLIERQKNPDIKEKLKNVFLSLPYLSPEAVTEFISDIREKSILVLSQSSTEEDISNLVYRLQQKNLLSLHLILRAACAGDMKLLEYALAAKADIPVRYARVLIYDSGKMGLKRLYEEANLPPDMFPAIQTAVKTFTQMLEETEEGYKDNFSRRMVERLLMIFDEKGIVLDASEKQHFLKKITYHQQKEV